MLVWAIIYTLVITLSEILAMPFTAYAVTDAELQTCYEKHPMFLNALMIYTDKEFADRTQAALRKPQIEIEFKRSPESVKECYFLVVRYAQWTRRFENVQLGSGCRAHGPFG